MKSLKLITLLSIVLLVSFSHVAFGMKRKRVENDIGEREKKRQKLAHDMEDFSQRIENNNMVDEGDKEKYNALVQEKDKLEKFGMKSEEIKRNLVNKVRKMELKDDELHRLIKFADFQGSDTILRPLASAYAFKNQFSVNKERWSKLNPNVAVEIFRQHSLDSLYPIKIEGLDDEEMEELAKHEFIKREEYKFSMPAMQFAQQIYPMRAKDKRNFNISNRRRELRREIEAYVKNDLAKKKVKRCMEDSEEESYISLFNKESDMLVPILDYLGSFSQLYTSNITVDDLINEGYIDEKIKEAAKEEAFENRDFEDEEQKERLEDPDFLFENSEFISPDLFKMFDKIKLVKKLKEHIIGHAESGNFNVWLNSLRPKSSAIRMVTELVCDIVDKKINENRANFREFFNSIEEENLLKMALRIKYYNMYGGNVDRGNISGYIPFFVVDRDRASKQVTLRLSHMGVQDNWVVGMFLYLAHYMLDLTYDSEIKIKAIIRKNQQDLFGEAFSCNMFLNKNINEVKIDN